MQEDARYEEDDNFYRTDTPESSRTDSVGLLRETQPQEYKTYYLYESHESRHRGEIAPDYYFLTFVVPLSRYLV